MLGPGNLTTHLADLGADVIKVEPPQGDYGRRMTWPIVEGVSLLFLHISRGKKSIVLDLRTDAGRETFLELVRDADAVVEAMRPGGLDRRGLGFDAAAKGEPRASCSARSPVTARPGRTATCRVTASRTTCGPGIVEPEVDADGFAFMPEHVSIGINVGPVFGALGLLAGVLRARETGEGCQIEIAQSDAAAAIDWLRSETWHGVRTTRVGGHRQRGRRLRAPSAGHRRHGSRRALPVLRDE